jgi:PKD repeat protein
MINRVQLISLISSIILIWGIFLQCDTVNAEKEGVQWGVEIVVTSISTMTHNACTFGACDDATSGDPPDKYDAPAPPLPPSPYVICFFQDGMTGLFSSLNSDYRPYNDGVSKQWNLTITWEYVISNINLSWDSEQITGSEFDSITLCDAVTQEVLVNMLSEFNYSFIPSANIGRKEFVIKAEYWDKNDDEPVDDQDNSDDGGDLPPEDNQFPSAHIKVNNMTGIIGSTFYFSAEESTDDGFIISYEWDFGNGETKVGMNITYVYQMENSYQVTLTVTDNQGLSSTDSIIVIVTTGNHPPTIFVDAPEKGHQHIPYNFSMNSSDPNESDLVRYIVDWGDGSQSVISQFYPADEGFIINHSWESYGVYPISFYAEDQDSARSTPIQVIFSVDAEMVSGDVQGYLFDEDSDGAYDGFFDQQCNEEHEIELIDEDTYQLQIDDTFYSINIGTMKAIKNDATLDSDKIKDNVDYASVSDYVLPIIIFLFLIVIISIIIFLLKY